MKAIEIIDRYWIMNTFGKYWELTKYEVRNLAISMGKSLLLLNDRRNVELQNKLWSCLVKKNYFPRIIKFVIITNRIRHSLWRESKGCFYKIKANLAGTGGKEY